jgi:hypothetical protein
VSKPSDMEEICDGYELYREDEDDDDKNTTEFAIENGVVVVRELLVVNSRSSIEQHSIEHSLT